MQIYWNKRKHFHKKEFNSDRIFWVHQHGRSFIVWEHQYGRRDVMWKRSITENAFRIFFQPDWQIDNGFFNRLTMARTQILVHRW